MKYLCILFLIILLLIIVIYKLFIYKKQKINIFCFWEPTKNIPIYLKLCMNTWNKISNSNIILLNYSNLYDYIDKDIFHSNWRKLSLSMQADCIRVALLEKYGGLWLDLDTIILNDFTNLLNNKLTIFGDAKNLISHIGFIYTKYPHNKIMKEWLTEIQKKLIHVGNGNVNWNYVGNSIIDKLLKKYRNDVNFLDRNKYNIFPEFIDKSTTSKNQKYLNFWFNSNRNIHDIKSKYLIMLHNSWTPNNIKKMNMKQLQKDSSLLFKFLNSL